MKLSELGEFGLIHHIRPMFPVPTGDLLGIGDDCAVLFSAKGKVELVTTDLLIENIHFLFDKISPEELGHKALAVNLSDIAAMGGKPTAAFMSIGLPPDIEVAWLDRFFSGFKKLSDLSQCPLLGGDTTKSKSGVIINITVLGSAESGMVKFRSTAKPGDVVAVTGYLGESGTGLRLLLEKHSIHDGDQHHLVNSHHRPTPHLAEGAWLAQQSKVHAMMDVSDGIDSDLQRIMELSGVGISIDISTLPISAETERVCAAKNWSAREIAATGGEDYCLLCTIASSYFNVVAEQFYINFGRHLSPIGLVTKDGGLQYHDRGVPISWNKHGFDHFKA